MIDNQFDRRNLSELVRMDLALERKSFVEQRAKERMHHIDSDVEPRSPVTYPPEEQGKTLEILAKQAGVSYGKLFQYNKVLEKGTKEEVQAVKNNEISVKGAYQKIQKAERLEQNKQLEWPKGKYRVIYADPPWKYGDERSGMGGAADQYDLMELEDIKALPVADLAEDDAVLFMWATAPLMREAWEVLDAWGFKYKTQFIWNKCKGPVGNYISVRHEHLILATKGSCTPDVTDRPNSVQTIERTGRHSAKPEEFRQLIEQLYTYGNKIELFTRKKVEGWVGYGNEIPTNDEELKIAGY